MEAVILCGIQATGKSTFCHSRLYSTHIRLNLDMLKTRHREDVLFEACLRAKQPFVVDNTNPYRLAVIRGTIVERRHEGADQDIDNLARKYLGQPRYPGRDPAQQRVTLIIKPTHVLERGTE